MLRIENQPGMSRLRRHTTRLRTSLSTAPPITPVNRNQSFPVPLFELDDAVGNRKLVGDYGYWFWNWQ
jgi:hypothetical protein